MTRDDLLALAARVEAAMGPDRELDFEIAAAVGWPDSPRTKQHARRYTDSLDAALTLVPHGYEFVAETTLRFPADKQASAIVAMPKTREGFPGAVMYLAATPALALTAAALRARAEQAPHD